MLLVDLGVLSDGPVATKGQLSPEAPVLADVDFALRGPVRVSGRLMESGSGSYFWDARIRAEVGLECRRCLGAVDLQVDQSVRLLFTADQDADDPSTYPIPADVGELDLTEPVREELILAVPRFALCRDDCRGLCAQCGKDLNAGPCDCRPAADPRWAALEALKGPPAEG